MQSSISTAAERRSLVVELIAEGHGSSQQSLVDALAARGVDVTQATLSRDLKELGAVKGAAGYVVPAASASPLVDALGRWLVSARAAQNRPCPCPVYTCPLCAVHAPQAQVALTARA